MDSKFSKGKFRRCCCVIRIRDTEESDQCLETHLQKYRKERHMNMVKYVGLYLHATVTVNSYLLCVRQNIQFLKDKLK